MPTAGGRGGFGWMSRHRYGDLAFDDSFLVATRGADEELRFTRQERALLRLFTENANRLLNRGQILDVLTYAGSDVSDRNVDFLVNRLRNKLGDNARAPRYIATQYGEGYVWIARASVESIKAFLVIGPCYGMADAETAPGMERLLASFAQALDLALGQKHAIALKPHWRPSQNAADDISYGLEVSLHAERDGLHAALVLRAGSAGPVIGAFRANFPQDDITAAIEDAATRIKDSIWAHRALPPASLLMPRERPLEVRIHDAARLLTKTPESWKTSTTEIESACAEAPNDPALAIMRGLALYAALIQGASSELAHGDWGAVEDEIETLVLNCLPSIQDNPLLVLGAAKLLFFIDRGHIDLAERLADSAFEKSTAFAAAFATRAQMRMSRGAFHEALSLYDKAIELSEPRSEFHIYLLILKITALMAADDRKAVKAHCAELYKINPMIRMQIGLFCSCPEADALPDDLEAMLVGLGKPRAMRLVSHLYNVSARHFQIETCRQNVMRGLLQHVKRVYGSGAIPLSVFA